MATVRYTVCRDKVNISLLKCGTDSSDVFNCYIGNATHFLFAQKEASAEQDINTLEL